MLMKHEGRKKAKKDFPNLKIMKRDWYNNKTYRHKKSQTLYSIRAPSIVLQQINKDNHLDPNWKKRLLCHIILNL
jgi:hypothetical protein